ncbi:hypothetical protein ECSE_P2-0096 (plasmid) [Escherichia coli SE11]|uniref:Uncharacterized protein n=1 Tax=Escherichia coli (strain SE11) TaxID=409438 RepID=A0A979GJI3_ECOSE|nr:hypothetical protein ECSE_P2-0096 [Escherichia coli SE11]
MQITKDIGEFFETLKGRKRFTSCPLTFPLSSVDELANQFQNCNQRVCNGDHSPENDD